MRPDNREEPDRIIMAQHVGRILATNTVITWPFLQPMMANATMSELRGFKRSYNKMKCSKTNLDLVVTAMLMVFSRMINRYNLSPIDIHLMCTKIRDRCAIQEPELFKILHSDLDINEACSAIGKMFTGLLLEIVVTYYEDLQPYYEPVHNIITGRGLYFDEDYGSDMFPDIIMEDTVFNSLPNKELLRLNTSVSYSDISQIIFPYLQNPVPNFDNQNPTHRWTVRRWGIDRSVKTNIAPMRFDDDPDLNIVHRYEYELTCRQLRDREEMNVNPCYKFYKEVCIKSMYRMEEDLTMFYVKGFFSCALYSFGLASYMCCPGVKLAVATEPYMYRIF